jgi:hypothetical protein
VSYTLLEVLVSSSPSALRRASCSLALLGCVALGPAGAVFWYHEFVGKLPPHPWDYLLLTAPAGGAVLLLGFGGLLLEWAAAPGASWARRQRD